MEKGLSVLKSLREEIKKVSVPDTGVYNLELREAIEANLMLDAAELTFGSAMFRKESRGHPQYICWERMK